MARRFYLSTKKDRSADGAATLHALTERGWQCTFDWTAFQESGAANLPTLAQAEIEGIRQADILIVLLPGGFGTHVEIGAALALEKPVILHTPSRAVLETPYPCAFHYHPGVRLIVSSEVDVESIIAALPV
jgi:Nucleoside 2-deoxyribosyltransferase